VQNGGTSNDQLTKRQIQILESVAEGLPDAVAAKQAFVSHRTFRRELATIQRKLGAATRPQAVAEGLRRGLVG
jgi:DNA-binding NarL/FixJ family response regulator